MIIHLGHPRGEVMPQVACHLGHMAEGVMPEVVPTPYCARSTVPLTRSRERLRRALRRPLIAAPASGHTYTPLWEDPPTPPVNAPAANGCLGTGGCVSGHLGPMNCEL